MSNQQRPRVGAVAPPINGPVPVQQPVVAPVVEVGGCGGYSPVIPPIAPPLYPPFFNGGNRPAPSISVNVAPGQTASGALLLAGTNFINGDIRSSGNRVTVGRSGKYIVDLTLTVTYAGAGSAYFQTVPGYGTYIAGGAVTAAGTQVYNGSVILDLTRGSTISITSVLTGATVTGGTLSVQMVPGTDRRRGNEDLFFEDPLYYY